jgi:hypothetical protein
MPENEDPKEQDKPQETEGNPGEAQANSNGAPISEDLEAIKAELEEEKKAKAAVEAALAEKDARISELNATLNVALQGSEAAATELAQIKEAHAKAVAKYLDVVRTANPTIPKDIIVGQTIEEIDASLEKAEAIADAIRANLEAQAKEAKVPAGAPTRGTISLEGLSPREKIAAGIQQKGGTS